jgi:5-methylcytosine-specific restriction endonuclease McrA
MQLLKDVPQAQKSLAQGEVNLMTLSMAQSQIRAAEKVSGEKVSHEQKIEIVESIKNKTQAQAEIELFKALPKTASCSKTHMRRISETETRMSLNVSDELLDTLNRLKEIWSHVNPNMNYAEIIERCASDTLKRVDPAREPKRKSPTKKLNMNSRLLQTRFSEAQVDGEGGVSVVPCATRRVVMQTISNEKAESESEQRSRTPGEKRINYFPLPSKRTKYFSVKVKSHLHQKAEGRCEYIDPISKRCCRSRFLLQTDHIIPIWAGGSNDLENLQLLCATHNRLKYKLETNQLSDQIKTYRRTKFHGF